MEDDKQLLQRAREEILNLRRRNEVLEAKVDAMEMFAMVLRTEIRYPSHGAAIDVAWELQKRIEDFEAKKEPANEQPR